MDFGELIAMKVKIMGKYMTLIQFNESTSTNKPNEMFPFIDHRTHAILFRQISEVFVVIVTT